MLHFRSGKLKRSHSTSSTVEGCGEEHMDHLQVPPAIVRIKLKLTYICAQEKMNISILEAENFFLGRPVYFKVRLIHLFSCTRNSTLFMVLHFFFVCFCSIETFGQICSIKKYTRLFLYLY